MKTASHPKRSGTVRLSALLIIFCWMHYLPAQVSRDAAQGLTPTAHWIPAGEIKIGSVHPADRSAGLAVSTQVYLGNKDQAKVRITARGNFGEAQIALKSDKYQAKWNCIKLSGAIGMSSGDFFLTLQTTGTPTEALCECTVNSNGATDFDLEFVVFTVAGTNYNEAVAVYTPLEQTGPDCPLVEAKYELPRYEKPIDMATKLVSSWLTSIDALGIKEWFDFASLLKEFVLEPTLAIIANQLFTDPSMTSKPKVVVKFNFWPMQLPPFPPAPPRGAQLQERGQTYTYDAMTTDPHRNNIRYEWDFTGDFYPDHTTGFYSSGEMSWRSWSFETEGEYQVRLRAVNDKLLPSTWSSPLKVIVRDTRPPVITDVQVNRRSDTEVTVTWLTDERSTSTVRYWIDPSVYVFREEVLHPLLLEHTIPLTGLQPDTRYYFTVESHDGKGHGMESTPQWFITLSSPAKLNLMARQNNGDLYFHPFRRQTFGLPDVPVKVGNGWHFADYFPADWTGDGNTDLLVRTTAGDLLLYPFEQNAFADGGIHWTVGHGFQFAQYFIGDWTGDGIPDLLARKASGEVFLYPFKKEEHTFISAGRVATDWQYTHYFPEDWNKDGTCDMMARDILGNFFLLSLDHGSFHSMKKTGTGFHFTHYFPADWTGDGMPDLLARTTGGEMVLYVLEGDSFILLLNLNGNWNYTEYYPADWNEDGTADLIVRDGRDHMFLFPFKNNQFGELPLPAGQVTSSGSSPFRTTWYTHRWLFRTPVNGDPFF